MGWGRLTITLAALVAGLATGAATGFGAPAAEGDHAQLGCEATAGLLATGLIIALGALLWLVLSRQRVLSAHRRLAAMTQSLKAGESTRWTATGVADVDAIALALEEFDHRLRQKRAKLTKLNEELIKHKRIAGPAGFNNQLRAIIDAMPVGVLIAEAPSGRILEGNRAIESILRHPIIYSENLSAYSAWTATHENGAAVQALEFPLARALAGEERPTLECRYRRGDGSWCWIEIVGAPIRNDQNKIIGAIVAIMDIDGIKTAEERGRIMNLELHHRVNNTLAMIQGIANITARTATDFACFRGDFSDRIQCLSRISTLLVKKSWTSTPVKDLVATALACESPALRERISISDEEVDLRSEVALALGMALHELLSNAERYGALSTEKGQVSVVWRVAVDRDTPYLALTWTERDGPSVEAPRRVGIGQYLMKNVLARQFGGEVQLEFRPEGVRATITAEI